MPGWGTLSLRGRIRHGAVLLGAARPAEQTNRRVYAARSSGTGADLQGLRRGVRAAVRVPGLGSGQSATAHTRIHGPDGVAAITRRLVKPGVGKTRNRLLLGSVALSGGVAIVLVTHQDQAHAVWHSLTGVPVAALGLVLVLVLCQLSCQALRLWAILPRQGRLTVGQTAYAFTLGEWLNIFAPVRAGDALKVVLMSRTPGAAAPSLPKATGAVLADKIVDGGSLVLLCVATGLVSVIRAGAEARLGGARTAVAAGAGVALLLLGTWWARPHWLERPVVLRREFVEGLAALKDPVRLLTSVSFSLGAW